MENIIHMDEAVEQQTVKAPTKSRRTAPASAPVENARPRARRRQAVASKPKITDCQVINSLARGLKVLSAFGPEDLVLSNKDLAVRTGLPKPTVSRLTSTLVSLNFLVRDAELAGYRLGGAAVSLGISATSDIDLGAVARPFMRAFAEEHGVGINLGVRDGLEMRALAYTSSSVYGSHDEPIQMMFAARMPLGASALGYGLLACVSPPERDKLLKQLERQALPSWPNIRRRIEFALDDIQRNGYCSSLREWNGTINSAAIPLSFAKSGVPLSLACMSPSAQLPESRIRKVIGPAMVKLGNDIRRAFSEQKGSVEPTD